MPIPQETPRAKSAALIEKNFGAETAARADGDWYRFVIEELNGLGTMLRFDEASAGSEQKRIADRIWTTLETLGWDASAAVAQAWRFLDEHLRDSDDAWGPCLVLLMWEWNRKRVELWIADQSAETRAQAEHARRWLASREAHAGKRGSKR